MTPAISRKVRKVGIIGAGVAGLASAKTLIGEGLECTIFDRADHVGGVWADGYVNFGVQVQKELYEFPDWPLPGTTPNFTPGPSFQAYLEGYCDHFGLRPHLQLNTQVRSIVARRNGGAGWEVTVECDGRLRSEAFDLVVIATGLYSETPHIPNHPGQNAFSGQVLHVSDIRTRAPLEDRRLAVIGYGKSATDIAGEAVAVAEKVHLVFREAHWPVPRKLAGVLPFKWGMLHRLTATLIPPYMRCGPVARWVHGPGWPLVWIFWRSAELLLRVQLRLGTRITNGRNLVPSRRVEHDCFGDSTMVPRPGFIDLIRGGQIVAHRTEIDRFTPTGLALADGDTLEVDTVVFGTGWNSDYRFLSPEIRTVLGEDEDGFYLYRHMLHPDLANLVFVGRASTFLSPASYCVQARWLAEALAGRVDLPDRDAMLAEIELMKHWKRSWMPASGTRGARILLHMGSYHDELLRDFGANPYRKRGPLAPLKELLEPYQSRDYRDIASGEFIKRSVRHRQHRPAEPLRATGRQLDA